MHGKTLENVIYYNSSLPNGCNDNKNTEITDRQWHIGRFT